jgi:hypothetical protein
MPVPDHIAARAINLTFNLGLATAVPWLQVRRSIFGDWGSLRRQVAGYATEGAAFRSPGTLTLAVVPFAGWVLETGSGPLPRVDPPPGSSPFPRERWFLINGICTDLLIAGLNAKMLAGMFCRPITPLFNATDGFAPDLFECALGKGFDTATEAVAKNLLPLVQALCDEDVDRVVLISHSQGTIIAAVMLKWLEEVLSAGAGQAVRDGPGRQKRSPERKAARRLVGDAFDPNYLTAKPAHDLARSALQASDIGKLEVYCFANCSTAMGPIAVVADRSRHAPWIESYGNEFDLIARLGVLAPPHGIGSARIDGDCYRRDGAWGHLLNAHYLNPMLVDLTMGASGQELTPFPENLLTRPRLYDYFGGGTPVALPR